MFNLYVDVGHGGTELNEFILPDGTRIIERDTNLILAQKFRELVQLRAPHINILLSRESNEGTAQWDAIGINASAERCKLWAAQMGEPVNLMLSFHNNGSLNHNQSGYQIIHSVQQPAAFSFEIAKQFDIVGHVQNAIYSRQYSGGIWSSKESQLKAPTDESDYYGIIRQTIGPETHSVIIEFCFYDNLNDVKEWLWDMDKMKALLNGVLQAILNFFKIESVPLPQPEPEPIPKPDSKGFSVTVEYMHTSNEYDTYKVIINGTVKYIDIPVKTG